MLLPLVPGAPVTGARWMATGVEFTLDVGRYRPSLDLWSLEVGAAAPTEDGASESCEYVPAARFASLGRLPLQVREASGEPWTIAAIGRPLVRGWLGSGAFPTARLMVARPGRRDPRIVWWTPQWTHVLNLAVAAWNGLTLDQLGASGSWTLVRRVAQTPEHQAALVAAWRMGTPAIELFSLVEDLSGTNWRRI